MFGTLLEIVKSDRKLATSNKATEVHCQKIADFEWSIQLTSIFCTSWKPTLNKLWDFQLAPLHKVLVEHLAAYGQTSNCSMGLLFRGTCCQPAVSHSPWSAEAFFQCSLNERFLYSAFCEALCSVHAVAKAICSDALKIHLASQMISVHLRLSARHSLRHAAPARVSMYQNLSATVVTSIRFQNLPWHREVAGMPNERWTVSMMKDSFQNAIWEQPKVFALFVSVRYYPTQCSLARDFST